MAKNLTWVCVGSLEFRRPEGQIARRLGRWAAARWCGPRLYAKGVRLDPLKPLDSFEQQRSYNLFALQAIPSDGSVEDRLHL